MVSNRPFTAFLLFALSFCSPLAAQTTPIEAGARIAVSADKTHFINQASGQPFVVWGVNYDRDEAGRLLEEYWDKEWQTVVEDFGEIKALGANVVRVHLQLGQFMETATVARATALEKLSALVALAERTGLYLDITGLGCYHKADIPAWYDALPEAQRWDVQAHFWAAVAKTCAGHAGIFCYNLMNEPIIGGKPADGWLGDALDNKYYVQRIAIEVAGRDKKAIARAWINHLVTAIREHDTKTMVTVGVIPWALVFGPQVKPLFYDPQVCERLDFTSVHFYPRAGAIDQALTALAVYEVGKPLVIEETFPLHCPIDELTEFIRRSQICADGWVSFYWGTTIEELEQLPPTIATAAKKAWFIKFRELAARMQTHADH